MGYGKWLVGIVCLTATQIAPAAETCAECHQAIAATFAATGMGRSFRSASQSSLPARLQSLNFDHLESGEHFSARRVDDRYYIRRSAVSGREKVIDPFDAQVDYVIGSGDRAATFLHRTGDDQLVELPVTWYTSEGHWGMSPAYDRPDHLGFSRAIPYRCMFCHNAYPEVAAGPGDWDGATVFPAKLPEGIDCQRCHGPGAGHVTAVRQGKALREIQAAIVNPARLTAERQMEVCMQCHLETTTAQLPGSMMRFGRGVFSYQAGQPLSDYILYFDHAPGTGHDDKFEFVSTAYRLRKSACFTASAGRLTCTLCHDPHREQSREESLLRSNQACLKCHEAHTDSRDCVSCHMPRRRGADAIHIPVTDHWIQRPARVPADPPAIELHDGNTLPYAGEVAPYYPKVIEPLYLAIAQVNGLANLPSGLVRLEKLLTGTRPKEAQPYFEMGEALVGVGLAGKAIPFYQRAAEIEPRNWRYLFVLGQAQQVAGIGDRGMAAMERAASLAPYETSLRNGLGATYALGGRTGDALQMLREVLSRNPEDAAAQNNLGQALVRAGDLKRATAAFREAVRIRPEMVQIRMNLADVLMQTAQFREAASQIEEALRIGPSSAVMRSAWFSGLAAAGNSQEARRRYEGSLRKQTGEFHDNLGTALISSGDAEGAIREYRAAVDSDPESAVAALNLGLTLASHAQEVEARQWLEQALRLDAHQPEAHLVLGGLLLRAGLAVEGTAHLKIAVAEGDRRVREAAGKLLNGAR